MSSAEAQIAYERTPFTQPDEAQQNFSRQYDLSRPDMAMSSYQKIMFMHTQQQYQTASASSRRRSGNSDSGSMASLKSETSDASMSSTSS